MSRLSLAVPALVAALALVVSCSHGTGGNLFHSPPIAGLKTGSGKWTDPIVTVTSTSIGSVTVGMSMADAQAAAGVTFTGMGDGAHYPDPIAPGGPELYWIPNCLGASGGANSATIQTVQTVEGVKLGDPVQHLIDVYGGQARYIPQPAGGRTPSEGYVVDHLDGTVAFAVNDGIVTAIKVGARGQIDPSSCGG